jgi:hypothetical protein
MLQWILRCIWIHFFSFSLSLVSSLALSKCQRSSSFCGRRVYLVTFTWGSMR